MRDDRGFFSALIGDGRPLLVFTGLCLALSGAFALFLSATGHFLPHDIEFLGMQPEDLCAINECRIVHFMIHDRVSFGGALVGIGALYIWLAEFPLKAREPWAWWLFVVSGITGFGSFLAYLGYGYLDSWHGVATLGLLPCFVGGLVLSYHTLPKPAPLRSLLAPSLPLMQRGEAGRVLLIVLALGLIGAGATITTIGMTSVFVPQDLAYMGMTADELHAINPRLVPLIAHDRAGFGGGIITGGVLVFFCVWCGTPSRSLWQVLTFSGAVAFATAIGVHPIIGYTDWFHLLPAVAGGVIFIIAMGLSYRPMVLGASSRSTGAAAVRTVAGIM